MFYSPLLNEEIRKGAYPSRHSTPDAIAQCVARFL